MNRLIYFGILAVAVFLESSVISFDLVIIILLTFAVLRVGNEVLIEGFVVGILVDLLKAQTLGTSGFIFLIILTVPVLIKELFFAKKFDWYQKPSIKFDIILLEILVIFSITIINFWQNFLLSGKFAIHISYNQLIVAIIIAAFLYFLFWVIVARMEREKESQLNLFKTI